MSATGVVIVGLVTVASAAAKDGVSAPHELTTPSSILLQDDFDGISLDSAKWQCLDRNWPVGWTWFKGCPEVANGVVTLEHHTYNPHDPGGSCLSQEIVSAKTFERLNGLELVARVRVRAPIASGLVASFFTYTDRWVVDHLESDEFDFEFLTNQINDPPEPEGHRVVTTAFNDFSGQWNVPPYHWSSNPAVTGLDLSQFNMFKMHWWPDRIDWYWDPTPDEPGDADVLIASTNGVVPDEAVPVRFNFWAATCTWPAACDPVLQPAVDPNDDIVSFYDIDYVAVRRLPYAVEQEPFGSGSQYKCYRDGHHFLSIIDDGGVFILRPHPGVDINGWGSTLYLQPFLPGAVLGHTTINQITATANGIDIQAEGQVSRAVNETFGPWQASLSFDYEPGSKTVSGTGTYLVELDAALSSATGDLNLCKIASNYLDGVPTLRGINADTGDMESVHVQGDGIDLLWVPPDQPGFYPQNLTDWLAMDVRGQFNHVDTEAQGYAAIAPAYKPSLELTVISQQPGIPMIFGGQYDVGAAQAFWADNVGVTPLILSSSAFQQYTFDVAFISQALPGDGNDADFDGIVDGDDACSDTIFRVPVDPFGCPPAIRPDFNRDGDVDADDFALFEGCATGPAIPLAPGAPTLCQEADLDNDGDVDQSDLGIFQRCYSGEDNPADPNCAD